MIRNNVGLIPPTRVFDSPKGVTSQSCAKVAAIGLGILAMITALSLFVGVPQFHIAHGRVFQVASGIAALVVAFSCFASLRYCRRPSEEPATLTPVETPPPEVRFLPLIARPSEDGSGGFPIGDDGIVALATFLSINDLLTLRAVSRQMQYTIDTSDVVLKPLLEGFRLWGGTNSSGHQWIRDDLRPPGLELTSIGQLRAYREIYENKRDYFFDYIARLMPGGPIVFTGIPVRNVADIANLSTLVMKTPLMRGEVSNGVYFAMRIQDDRTGNPAPLIFARIHNNYFWNQLGNVHFDANHFNVNNDVGPILSLLKGESVEGKSLCGYPQPS